jgi:chemotaxis protein MotB
MADKGGGQIVIKKITVVAGGAHGGSWKVAFADFMTAMMAFFLVMWLVNQTPEVKKQISRYFSGPSVIEQHFSIYGVELTLDKLFLDLVNEPLKAFQEFVQPADLTPDVMSLGSKKAALYHIARELGENAKNVEITNDEIKFDIPDYVLFEKGKADPVNQFTKVMDKLKDLTQGLENSIFEVNSLVYSESVKDKDPVFAEQVSEKRIDIIKNLVSFESDTNDLKTKISVYTKPLSPNSPGGWIQIRIKQKPVLPDGSKPRQLKGDLSERTSDGTVYNDFVKRMTDSNKRRR